MGRYFILVIYFLISLEIEAGVRREFTNNLTRKDPILGKVLSPNAEGNINAYFNEEVIFKSRVTTDAFARRVTPQTDIEMRSKHFLVFGCSMAFGTGVEDYESIAAFLAQELKQYYFYNYAIGGWGPNHTLYDLLKRPLSKEVPQKDGMAIFLLYPFHLFRAIPKLGSGYWTRKHPYFLNFKQERVVQFQKERPFLYWVLELGKQYSWFNSLASSDRSNFLYDSEREYFLELLINLKKTYEKKMDGNSELRFVLMGKFRDQKMGDMLRRLFPNLIQIDEQNLLNKEDYFPHDGHYQVAGNKKVAQEISRQLKLSNDQ